METAGQVAQLVEHRTENPGVAGSIPALSTVRPGHSIILGVRAFLHWVGAVVVDVLYADGVEQVQ
jgi:hypothetical protein